MKTLFAAAIAVSMLTGTVTTAYADNDRGRHERRYDNRFDHGGKDRHGYRAHDRRDHDRRDWERRDHDRRDWDRRHRNHDRHVSRDAYRSGYWQGRADQRRYDPGRYIAPRGYHVRAWRHGDYLPRSHYERRYIVHDYHAYHLHRPPHGQGPQGPVRRSTFKEVRRATA